MLRCGVLSTVSRSCCVQVPEEGSEKHPPGLWRQRQLAGGLSSGAVAARVQVGGAWGEEVLISLCCLQRPFTGHAVLWRHLPL